MDMTQDPKDYLQAVADILTDGELWHTGGGIMAIPFEFRQCECTYCFNTDVDCDSETTLVCEHNHGIVHPVSWYYVGTDGEGWNWDYYVDDDPVATGGIAIGQFSTPEETAEILKAAFSEYPSPSEWVETMPIRSIQMGDPLRVVIHTSNGFPEDIWITDKQEVADQWRKELDARYGIARDEDGLPPEPRGDHQVLILHSYRTDIE